MGTRARHQTASEPAAFVVAAGEAAPERPTIRVIARTLDADGGENARDEYELAAIPEDG